MLKNALILLMFTLCVNYSYGAIILEEDFSGSISDDPKKAKIISSSLDFRYHTESGNRLWIKDYDQGVIFNLPQSIDEESSTPVLYVSFCLRSLNQSTRDKFAGVVFYDGDREIFGLGNDYSSENFAFWGPDGSTHSIGDAKTQVDNEVHMIVCKIEFHDNGPEDITVGVNPFGNRSLKRQPKTIWTTYQAELSFNQIRIRCGHNDCTWEFDELRLGTDWASVMPADNQLGPDYQCYLDSAMPEGDSEIILDDVARFLPDNVSMDDVLPSMALQTPREKIADVPQNWEVKPVFGVHNGKKYAYLSLPAEVDLYGTGEVVGGLMRNGSKIRLFNKDNGAYGDQRGLYQSHPWVVGVRPDGTAFGVIFDTTWLSEINLRAGVLFTVPEHAPWFPTIVIEGDSPQDILSQLGVLTGTMPMPPRWALGYQQCRYSYYPDARAREIADTFRDKQIPCDVIWFDIHYMDGYRIFTFDKNRYPDPKATNDYLHSKGFKSVWMIDPGVKYEPGYFAYDSGTAVDAWVKDASGKPFVGNVWPGACVFPDFSSPSVREWWGGLYKDFMATGIDGVWNDMNEPAVFGGDEMTMPMDNKFRGGGELVAGPHEQYHNVFGMLMVRASRGGIQAANPDKRPFVLTRANYLGGHRYAATWTGDNNATWEHLRWSIPMSLTLGLSGQPFSGPDIGGFLNNATPDLWGHWVAVGAFYPFSRSHTCDGTANQEPWEFGPEVESAARIALQRRYRLMPYLYTVFHESHEQGLPVMRPLFFADTTDLSLRMEDRAFLVGDDLMVIPRWAENTACPKGIWQTVTIANEDLSKDKYQCEVKQRGGSIIPLGPVVQSTVEIPQDQKLTLMIVLDENGQAKGSVYEDAGDGYDFQDGKYRISEFTASKTGNTVVVKCINQAGGLKIADRKVSVIIVLNGKEYHGYGNIYDANGINIILDQPLGWSSQDIGDVSINGTFSGSGDLITVTGSGADIEGGADEFHFVYRQLTGDFELIAKVVDQRNTHEWAKAGLMVRDSLAANSSHAMAIITPENGAAFQRRLYSGANGTIHTGVSGIDTPQWLRLVRSSDTVSGYFSSDSKNWQNIGTDTISLSNTVYAGLAVTSHNDGVLSTVTFDNFKYLMGFDSVDCNSDGIINLSDFSYLAANWLRNGSGRADINGDGAVNVEDILQVIYKWLLDR